MNLRLWWWVSTGHRAAALRAALGVALVVALGVSGLSLLSGLSLALQEELSGLGGVLRVRAPSMSIGAFDLTGGMVPGRVLDEEAVLTLSQLDGVQQAQREAWARVPSALTGSFLGQRVQSEGALLGVEAAAVDNPPDWDWSPGETVPVLAPKSILAVYNGSFAPTHGLPRLNDSAVEGLRFTILAGRSLYGRSRSDRIELPAEVVGTAQYGGVLAAIVPLETVRWIEQQADVEDPGRLSSVRLVLAPDADPSAVDAAVRALGWTVEQGDGVMQKLAGLLRSVQLGLSGTAAALLGVLLLGVAQLQGALLQARAGELRVLRVLGLGPGAMALGLMGELALSVALSAVLGLGAGLLLAGWGAEALSDTLSEQLGLGLRLQPSLPGWAWVACLLGPPLGAVLLTLPSLWVLRRDVD